jgi:hypothetical protein
MTAKTNKTMIKSASAAIGLSLLLWGCGGGGGGGGGPIAEATTKLTGVAIDGYLEGATAFLDLNDNGKHDPNEPQSTTGKQGDFVLNATASQFAKHRVVVLVPRGAIDSNTGVVDAPFSLTSPAGQGGVVSPLTTLVAAHMADGLSFEDAQNKVQEDLGLESFDVMENFMTSPENEAIQKMAVALTESLKTIDSPDQLKQFSEARLRVESKIKPFKDQILNFDLSQGWKSLKTLSNTLASPQLSLPLNDNWIDFLLQTSTINLNAAKLTNDSDVTNLKGIASFSIKRTDQTVTLSTSASFFIIDRILTFDDRKLVSIASHALNKESINFDVATTPHFPELVSDGISDLYFSGTYSNENNKCADTTANFTIKTGNEIDSLKFMLTFEQSEIKPNVNCIDPFFRPSKEIYEFTLTNDQLKLDSVTAETKLGILSMTFD